jgi:hypothetical protein
MRRARDSRAQGVWLAFGSPHPEAETQMPIVATATSMKHNQLGRTGLYVSEICLGTMTFGGSEGGDVRKAIGGLQQDEADGIVGRALEAGELPKAAEARVVAAEPYLLPPGVGGDVEPSGISRPIMAGQSGIDSGSQWMPLFSGATRHSPANPMISDVGSEAMPVWESVRPAAVARK